MRNKAAQKRKNALVVVALLISLAGLSCYWLNRDHVALSPSPVRTSLTQQTYSIRRNPAPVVRGFEYQAFRQPDNYIDSPGSPYMFQPDIAKDAGHETAIDELDISG